MVKSSAVIFLLTLVLLAACGSDHPRASRPGAQTPAVQPTASSFTAVPTQSCPLSSSAACQALLRIANALRFGDTDAVAAMFAYEETQCAAYVDPLMVISPVVARYAGCLHANPDLETRCLWVLNERTPASDCRASLATLHTCACGNTNANFRHLTRDQIRDFLLPSAHVIGVIERVGFTGQSIGPFILIDTDSRPIPEPYGAQLPNHWALQIDEKTGEILIAYPHNSGAGWYFEDASYTPWQ